MRKTTAVLRYRKQSPISALRKVKSGLRQGQSQFPGLAIWKHLFLTRKYRRIVSAAGWGWWRGEGVARQRKLRPWTNICFHRPPIWRQKRELTTDSQNLILYAVLLLFTSVFCTFMERRVNFQCFSCKIIVWTGDFNVEKVCFVSVLFREQLTWLLRTWRQ